MVADPTRLAQALGCQVAVASSGEEGIELAQRFAPEVVLCDLGLPGIDGYMGTGWVDGEDTGPASHPQG